MSNYAPNSLFAFQFIQPKLSDRQKEVYEAMRMYGRPFTDKDLAKFMDIPINCLTGRRGELLKKGLLRSAGNIIQDGRKASLWEVGRII